MIGRRIIGYQDMAALAFGAAMLGASPAVAAGPQSLGRPVDQERLKACASEAVRWSLLERDISDMIFVDGTSKFHHIRVDGYARHWDERIWAFVSVPVDPETGTNSLVIGYVDPANGINSPRNEEKRRGMRQVLNLCLKNGWSTAGSH